MEYLHPSDLKTIIHSKRANIYYLQYCRVLVNGGRVEYVTGAANRNLYWNIPIANTTVLLLGTGTSITQAAMRELSKAGVLVGFCGGGGTPLFNAIEREVDDVAWLQPQSEYRPTEYLQRWVHFWFDDKKRLEVAKLFQYARLAFIENQWAKNCNLKELELAADESLYQLLKQSQEAIKHKHSANDLLAEEARLTKLLYRLIATKSGYGSFTRAKRGKGTDPANSFLDHGNYLAYGLGATATWVLGLPHGLAVLHGKTRRGGLVFDVADLVKDALVLPQAFLSAVKGDNEQEFRQTCIDNFAQAKALDYMIETIKDSAQMVSGD